MTAKRGNRSKALRVVGILLGVIIAVLAVFTIISPPVG